MTPVNPEQAVTSKKTTPKPLVIYGGPLYDGKGNVYADGAVYVSESKIAAAGTEETVFTQIPKSVDIEVYDTRGSLITPGFINLWNHFYRAFGLGLPAYHPNDFSRKQQEHFWWKYDQCLDEDTIQLATLLGIMEAIKQGTTTLFDWHSTPLQISNTLSNIAAVVTRAGFRAVLSCEISGRHGDDIFNRALAENQQAKKELSDNPFVRTIPGIQCTGRPSDKALSLIKASIADGETGLQIEIASDDDIKRLDSLQLLNAKTALAGPVIPGDQSLEILQNTGATFIITAIFSGDYSFLSSPEINVGIGTAGQPGGIPRNLQNLLMTLTQKGIDSAEIFTRLEKLIRGNNRFAELFFPDQPGIIEPGSAADIVVFDYVPVSSITEENYHQHLFFGLPSMSAKMVMIGGKFIYNEDSFLTIDREIIIEESQKAFRRLREKFEKL